MCCKNENCARQAPSNTVLGVTEVGTDTVKLCTCVMRGLAMLIKSHASISFVVPKRADAWVVAWVGRPSTCVGGRGTRGLPMVAGATWGIPMGPVLPGAGLLTRAVFARSSGEVAVDIVQFMKFVSVRLGIFSADHRNRAATTAPPSLRPCRCICTKNITASCHKRRAPNAASATVQSRAWRVRLPRRHLWRGEYEL